MAVIPKSDAILQFASPINAVRAILDELGLEAGVTCDLTLHKSWSLDTTKQRISVGLSFNSKSVRPGVMRSLKRDLDLKVPEWAKKWGDPNLEASREFKLVNGTTILDVHFSIGGVYVCEKVGEIEEPPSESDQTKARELLTLTPEQALEKVRADAEKLLEPTKRAEFRCTPVK